MFLRVACLALLQLTFYRGYSVEACSHDSDCSQCIDHNLHATCVNIHNDNRGPYCVCKPDPCLTNPCSSGKHCVHTGNAPFYVCEAVDTCENHIQCQHGGSCRYDNGHVKCQCRVGFTGRLCEVADPCENHIKCQHSGTCHYDMQGHATCQCPIGFTGQQCEIEDRDNDPCNPNPCTSNEDCIRFDNHSQTYECKGNCTYHMHCQNGGHCETTGHPEKYICICPPGFSGIVCESYSAEACSHDSDCPTCMDHNLQATCARINGVGHAGPVCHCNPVVCTNNSDCPCQHDNFHAICHQGGTGHSFCSCYPVHCDPSPCLSSQICVVETYHQSSVFRCRKHCTVHCPVGQTCMITYEGQKCIDPCIPNPCSSGKTCVHTDNAPFYVCNATHTNQTTTRPTDFPPTKETHTTGTTAPSTTEAASTSSPAPTPTPPQWDCSEFNITLHGCQDNTACSLDHVLPVICPDPKEAKYCPKKCGCC